MTDQFMHAEIPDRTTCRVCARGGPCAMHDEGVRHSTTTLTPENATKAYRLGMADKQVEIERIIEAHRDQFIENGGRWSMTSRLLSEIRGDDEASDVRAEVYFDGN